LDLIGNTDRRDLYNGFGDGLARAFEFAVTPVVFGAAGYGLDRWLGLFPLFTLVLLLFALTGQFVMMWIRYDAEMKAHEAGAVWNRRQKRTGA
jgi:Putative F0F1-ATPase subunit Ca2+/Mg2+ transporter